MSDELEVLINNSIDEQLAGGSSTEGSNSTGEASPSTPAGAPEGEQKAEVSSPTELAMPKSWRQEKAQVWTKLDKEAREEIIRREEDQLKFITSNQERLTKAEALEKLFTPYSALLTSQGLAPEKAVQSLLNVHYLLSTNPEQRQAIFEKFAKTYGVDLTKYGKAADEGPYVDPATRELQERTAKLEGRIEEHNRAAAVAQVQELSAKVKAFAEDGKHPFFDECSDDIVAFIRQGMDLEAAYSKAVWANPVTREKLVAQQTAERQKKLDEEAKAAAEKAKRTAAAAVVSTESSRGPTDLLGSMDDTLKDTLAKIRARA